MLGVLLPFELKMNNCRAWGNTERLRAQDAQLRSNNEQTLRKGYSQHVDAQHGPEQNQQQSGLLAPQGQKKAARVTRMQAHHNELTSV
mmetsp:Transcript_28739/g.66078  ORF Transcript_28739/g.66078 Transcript_28739/m.66078 type:complete len:88 (+) Transcript_28739:261-524(+)